MKNKIIIIMFLGIFLLSLVSSGDYNLIPVAVYSNSTYIGGINDFTVIDGYAYIASGEKDTITVLNVSDPDNPSYVGHYTDGSGSDSIDTLDAIAVKGDYMYTNSIDQYFSVFDISGHSNPVHLGSFYDTRVWKIDRIVVGEDNNYVYCPLGAGDELIVVNVSDKSNPSVVGSYTNDTGPYSLETNYDLSVVGNYIYSLSYTDGTIPIFNVLDHLDPIPVGSLLGLDSPMSIDGAGDYVYVVGNYGNLTIIDVSNKSSPFYSGSYKDSSGDYAMDSPEDLYLYGDYVFIVAGDDNILTIIDVADPSNPTPVVSYSNTTSIYNTDRAKRVVASGDYVYLVSDSNESMSIFNFVTPDIEKILLNLTYYPENVSQNSFFNITVNVTCNYDNCGEVNVTLDPEPILKTITDIEGLEEIKKIDKLRDEKSSASSKKKRYIIEFNEEPLIKNKFKDIFILGGFSNTLKKSSIKNEHDNFVNRIEKKKIKVDVVREFDNSFNGMIIEINEDEDIKDIEIDGTIWEDNIASVMIQDSVPLTNADDLWNIQNDTGINITGEGMLIAILDTGIDYTNSNFGSCTNETVIGGTCDKIPYAWDFVNDDQDPWDNYGHGTHVAGIIGANGEVKGVAPDSKFIIYKVCDYSGKCSQSDVISAIENATSYGVDVISMSLGSLEAINSSYNSVIETAMDNGVVVVAAIGNYGPNYFTVTMPGADPNAIGVGAIDKTDSLADFSSRGFSLCVGANDIYERFGVKPDVVSYGVEINSTIPFNESAYYNETGYMSLNGTSMATPHVSGIAALVKQAHPDWTAYQIKSAISNTAIDLGYEPVEQGTGKVDALLSYNTSGVIVPNNLFMGNSLNKSIGSWFSAKSLTLTNLDDSALTYNLSIEFDEQGIVANLTQEDFELNSDESSTFNLSIYVDTSSAVTNTYFGKIICNISNEQSLVIPFGFYIETDTKGIIPNIYGYKPFYTNDSNPRTINLNQGESEEVTFMVNATGEIGKTYEFFVYANLTSNLSVGRITDKWNVTINESLSVQSVISNISDNSGTLRGGGAALFSAKVEDTNRSNGIVFNNLTTHLALSNYWVDNPYLYYILSPINQPGDDLAVSLWFKTSDENNTLIYHTNHFYVYLINGNEIYFYTMNYFYSLDPPLNGRQRYMNITGYKENLNDNQWHNLIAFWDNHDTPTTGNLSLFIDGNYVNTTIYEELNNSYIRWISSTMLIGDGSNNLELDEIRMYWDPKPDDGYYPYDIDLTFDEISTIYNIGRVNNDSFIPDQDDMAVWLAMDEGNGTIVYNKAPNLSLYQIAQYNPFFYGGYDNAWETDSIYRINFDVDAPGTYPYYWWVYSSSADYGTSDTYYYLVNTELSGFKLNSNMNLNEQGRFSIFT